MRFASIDVTNYRQYKSLTLTFDKGAHDLHIIIGENGTGKTNLLNAFTWCLYGVEPHLGDDDKTRGEPKLNKDAIHEALMDSRTKEYVKVTIELELDDGEIDRITRKMPVLVKSKTDIFDMVPQTSLQVQRILPGVSGHSLHGDQAGFYIDQILPEGIREYFFFDGEQLSNYFSERRSSAIKGAIHSIAQIDVITRMRNRTTNTVKKLKTSIGRTQPNIRAMNADIKKYEENERKLKKIIASNAGQVERATERIKELDETLRGIPDIAALEAQRDELQQEVQRHESAIKSARAEYITFARNAYVDFAFYDAVAHGLETVSEMVRNKQLPPDINRSYIEEMLRDHVCKVCMRPLNEEDHMHLVELLERYQVSSETSHILVAMRNEMQRLQDRIRDYPTERDKVLSTLGNAVKNRDNAARRLDDIEKAILANPDSENIKEWYEEREQLQRDRDEYNKKIGQRELQLKSNISAREKREKELEDALRTQTQQRDLADASAFGTRAAKILKDVENDVITEVRTHMSSRTESLFKGLVWKGSKCDRVELGESYQLALYDKTGYSCAATCSAAERALLALSFTLAMHEVSGFQSPLFIDTPIARASGENRANFADTLAEVSRNKQLILTFTPDEYSEAIATVFTPIAASYMHLTLDESEQIVTLRR